MQLLLLHVIMSVVQDLHNQTEKRTSTRVAFVDEELSRNLHVFGVLHDTKLPTIVNMVKDEDSCCEPKCKRVLQKSKLFTSRLENTQR